MPFAGETVGGRYRLIRPLGEGGMATVWAAEHLTMGNLVAVKIISANLADCDIAISRFTQEARAAARLRSPYVVQLFDHDIDPELGPYIAMELLEGENLSERLGAGTLAPHLLARILQQVCSGLTRAHRAGIIHRDLKPENIFLALDEEGEETAKILDFGVAKADSPLVGRGRAKTVAGALVGTLNYMSPEQAQGQPVDHLTDLWALGVIAFESLVGRRPFDSDAPGAVVIQICADPMPVPSEFKSDLPPGFNAWFARACNRDRAQRFSNARALAQSLMQVCDAVELLSDDVLSVDEPSILYLGQADASFDPPEPTPKRKRPVLQLVDSSLPPALNYADSTEVPEIDVEFELDYFVAHGAAVVGPVAFEIVRAGYRAGYVSSDSLLWTAGWPAWIIASEMFSDAPRRSNKRRVPNLSLVGPCCALPPGAPPMSPAPLDQPSPPDDPFPLLWPSENPVRPVPAEPVSAVRTTAHAAKSPRTPYYLVDGTLTVGPVHAPMLRCGLEAGKIPGSAWVWREGWQEWKPVSELHLELLASPTGPVRMLRNRPGIESVGPKCRLPSKAPPVTNDQRGRSNG